MDSAAVLKLDSLIRGVLATLSQASCFWLACFAMNRRAARLGWLKEGEDSWVPQPNVVRALLMGAAQSLALLVFSFVFETIYLDDHQADYSSISDLLFSRAGVFFLFSYFGIVFLIFRLFVPSSAKRSRLLLVAYLLSIVPVWIVIHKLVGDLIIRPLIFSDFM